MKKIFITIPWFLPAFRAGGPIQSVANLVKEFNEDVEYYIFCSNKDLDQSTLSNISTNTWTNYNSYTKIWYSAGRNILNDLKAEINKTRPDVLYIIGIYDWHFNITPLLFCKVPKKILSVRGMLHPGAVSQKRLKKKLFLHLFKILKLHRSIYFHATDNNEVEHIQKHFGTAAKICIAGNFPARIEILPLPKKEAGKLRLVSIALISPMKNILLALEALQNLQESIRYEIYGPIKDENYFENCITQIKKLPSNVSVYIKGEISPVKIKMALSDAHVFILPSKSENFGHAIYEALSAGRPVITSHFTPWNNLETSHAGINVNIEETTIAKAITHFAQMSNEELLDWSKGAADYARAVIDIGKIGNEYRQMFAL